MTAIMTSERGISNKTTSPVRGLVNYIFQAAKGNLIICLLLTGALATALLISGQVVIIGFFIMTAVGSFPYMVMMGMGGKNANKWERFQITMPIRRKDMVNSFYVSILLATVAGIPLVAIVAVIIPILHVDMFEYGAFLTFANLTIRFFSIPLLMSGLLFPSANTKAGEGRGEALFTICLIVAVGNTLLMTWLVNRFELPGDYTDAILALAVSLVAFLISYFITRRMYAKMDL